MTVLSLGSSATRLDPRGPREAPIAELLFLSPGPPMDAGGGVGWGGVAGEKAFGARTLQGRNCLAQENFRQDFFSY